MRQWPLVASAGRHKSTLPAPSRTAQSAYRIAGAPRAAGLRQIEEFSSRLDRLRRVGYLSAAMLLVLAGSCMFLFLHQVDIFALYLAGAVVMLLQIAFAASDYYLEERRTAQAYRRYLDTFSPEVLAMLRQSSVLSAWSRQEINRYLAAVRER